MVYEIINKILSRARARAQIIIYSSKMDFNIKKLALNC